MPKMTPISDDEILYLNLWMQCHNAHARDNQAEVERICNKIEDSVNVYALPYENKRWEGFYKWFDETWPDVEDGHAKTQETQA